MNPNEIHDEIRRTRDALMQECGGDLQRFGDLRRAGEARWVAAGHPVVSFAGPAPLELPLPDWEKIDAEPENEIISEIRAIRRQIMAERAAAEGKKAEGWQNVPPAEESKPTALLREEPPQP